MKRWRHRLDRTRIFAVFLLLAVACEDEPTGTTRTIRLVEPLTMTWSGSSSGVPYTGGRAAFAASSELRVVWSFRIEAAARPADGSRPRYVQQFDNQDHIQFSWDGHNNVGIHDFAPGDSCVATVTYRQLDPQDADNAKVVFKIEQ